MKILSKFQDYYDYACSFHSNETTYDRKIIYEDNEELINKATAIFKTFPRNEYQSASSKTKNREYIYGYIVIANNSYPFIKIKELEWNDGYKVISEDIYYTLSEKIEEKYNKYSIKNLKDFFNNIPSFDFKYPIAVIQSSGIKIDSSLTEKDNTSETSLFGKFIVYNHKLKDYKFQMDGRIVLQEIETFLNKGKEELKTVITNDKIIMEAKGFDKNSFKK